MSAFDTTKVPSDEASVHETSVDDDVDEETRVKYLGWSNYATWNAHITIESIDFAHETARKLKGLGFRKWRDKMLHDCSVITKALRSTELNEEELDNFLKSLE